MPKGADLDHAKIQVPKGADLDQAKIQVPKGADLDHRGKNHNQQKRKKRDILHMNKSENRSNDKKLEKKIERIC